MVCASALAGPHHDQGDCGRGLCVQPHGAPLVFLENAVALSARTGSCRSCRARACGGSCHCACFELLSARLKRSMSRMRLVAAAGHDMRTPITRMRLRAEFVPDEEDREKWLSDIDELERIADSAILLVREETGGDAPERLRLDGLVESICKELQEQKFDVTFTNGHPVTVLASQSLNRALRTSSSTRRHTGYALASVSVAMGPRRMWSSRTTVRASPRP